MHLAPFEIQGTHQKCSVWMLGVYQTIQKSSCFELFLCVWRGGVGGGGVCMLKCQSTASQICKWLHKISATGRSQELTVLLLVLYWPNQDFLHFYENLKEKIVHHENFSLREDIIKAKYKIQEMIMAWELEDIWRTKKKRNIKIWKCTWFSSKTHRLLD